jgi:hypothetical protein
MFEEQKAAVIQQQQGAIQRLCEINGIIGDIEYMLSTWSSDLEGNAMQAFSMASEAGKKSTGAEVTTLTVSPRVELTPADLGIVICQREDTA